MSARRRLLISCVAHEIAARTDPTRPARIAVDGITGAGKTTFADDLAELMRSLGAHVVRVSMDGFHNPRAVRYRRGRASPDGYYEHAYDLAGLRRHLLDPLGPTGDRRYVSALWDLALDRPATDPPVTAPDDMMLIVDGSFLQRPAVDHLALHPGDTAIDIGCGTGRALTHLRRAVGATGTVIGIDLTPAMAEIAAQHGTALIGDARRTPLPAAIAHGVFAAGLLTHLPDPIAGLHELARITHPHGHLALFHPIGRAALAALRGHPLHPDDIRDPANLPHALRHTGWTLHTLDDQPDRYLAIAHRTP